MTQPSYWEEQTLAIEKALDTDNPDPRQLQQVEQRCHKLLGDLRKTIEANSAPLRRANNSRTLRNRMDNLEKRIDTLKLRIDQLSAEPTIKGSSQETLKLDFGRK